MARVRKITSRGFDKKKQLLIRKKPVPASLMKSDIATGEVGMAREIGYA